MAGTQEQESGIKSLPLSKKTESLIQLARIRATVGNLSDHVSTGHLLLELIEDENIQWMLFLINCTPEKIRPKIEKIIADDYSKRPDGVELSLSPRSEMVLEKEADEEARKAGKTEIRPADIFLGIVSNDINNPAAHLFKDIGIDENKLHFLRSVSKRLRED